MGKSSYCEHLQGVNSNVKYRKFTRRKTGNPTINVNDFFNEDGGVKESDDALGNNAKVKI